MLLEISFSERTAAPGGHFHSAETPKRLAVRFMVAAFHGTASIQHTCE